MIQPGRLTRSLLLLLGLAPAGACRAIGGAAGADPDLARWTLVWADEFDGAACPDSSSWGYERGFVRNMEAQWYQPENARCDGGMLVIEGRRERKPNPNHVPGSASWRTSREAAEYTSASLVTRGRREFRYGRFEMRARIDVRPGLWPAFWTLGVQSPWPHNGEIDIMEYYRGMLLANAAWGGEQRSQAVWDTGTKPLAELGGAAWAERFHVWRMDWDEEEIRLSVDDLLLNATDLDDTVNRDAERRNPFHQPHYLILNLAIGGTNGGDPSATEFPAKLEVDYVRVYRREP